MSDYVKGGHLYTGCVRGEGWSRPITIDEDLTDATIELYVGDLAFETVEGGAEDDAIEVTAAVTGQFTLSLTGAQTATLGPGNEPLEVWITAAGAEPRQRIVGTFEVRRTVRE